MSPGAAAFNMLILIFAIVAVIVAIVVAILRWALRINTIVKNQETIINLLESKPAQSNFEKEL